MAVSTKLTLDRQALSRSGRVKSSVLGAVTDRPKLGHSPKSWGNGGNVPLFPGLGECVGIGGDGDFAPEMTPFAPENGPAGGRSRPLVNGRAADRSRIE